MSKRSLEVDNNAVPSAKRVASSAPSAPVAAAVALDAIALTELVVGPVELVVGPAEIVDCTIHYGSASIHMHKYVLFKMSKHLKITLTADTSDRLAAASSRLADKSPPCTMTSHCSRPGHLCTTLTGNEIGGIPTTVKDLHSFFKSLYLHSDSSKKPSELTKFPDYYYCGSITAVDPEKDETTCQIYQHDRISTVKVKGEKLGDKLMSTCEVGVPWFFRSYSHHPDYHLANYFDCRKLLQVYKKQAQAIVDFAKEAKMPSCLWRILSLADRFKWTTIRCECIAQCTQDYNCTTDSDDESWKKEALLVSLIAMIDVFSAAMLNMKELKSKRRR